MSLGLHISSSRAVIWNRWQAEHRPHGSKGRLVSVSVANGKQSKDKLDKILQAPTIFRPSTARSPSPAAQPSRPSSGSKPNAAPPPKTSSATREQMLLMQAELDALRAARTSAARSNASQPSVPSSSSSSTSAARSKTSSATREQLADVQAELAALKARSTFLSPRPPITSTQTREMLELALAEMGKMHAQHVRTVFSSVVAAIEVAFLVDCTASMTPHIKAVSKQVCLVASEVQRRFGGGNQVIRFAFVGYQDYDVDQHDRDLDFTTDLAKFKTYVDQLVVAPNGHDVPEDVYSGLEKMGELSWCRTGKDGVISSKMIFHMGDAPCHGSKYHKNVGDLYPGGDKEGRQISTLLRQLRVEKGVHMYHFSHITDNTETMLERFVEECGEEGWISQAQLGDELEKLSAQVLTVVARTVASSFTKSVAVGSIKQPRDYKISKMLPHEIRWKSIPAVQGSMFKCQPPESMDALLRAVSRKLPLKEIRVSDQFFLSVAPHPFSDEGAQRLPFYAMGCKGAASAIGSKDYLVAKVFRDGSRAANLPAAYKRQTEMQTVAAFLAQEFNKATAGLGMCPVRYITSATWTGSVAGKLVCYNVEQLVEGGRIVKFNNNSGYVNMESYTGTLQAFSHWTWQVTKGQLMVVDVQGLLSKDKEYVLVDPAIHCPSDPSRFTKTNLIDIGVQEFFMTHKCSDRCRALALRSHPSQIDTEEITRQATKL